MPPVRGVTVVSFRDLGALVSEVAYAAPAPDERNVGEYRRVVEGTFARQAILPATFGTIFRSRDALMRWLELHYFTLIDGITFLADRAMARVSVSYAGTGTFAATAHPITLDPEVVESTAAESFRVLRRHAVASLRATNGRTGSGLATRASFLVEKDQWKVFDDMIREEQRRLPEMKIECTGPWPPYDFVRMQFGG
jgi:hypothetical protein